MDIAPEISVTVSLPGTLVMYADSGPYLWDLKSGNQKKIGAGDESIGIMGVSPNREWLASYIEYSNNPSGTWLAVISADCKHLGAVELSDHWHYAGWIGNDRILLRKFIGGRENVGIENPFIAPATVINPFAGEQQKIPVDYPGLEEAAREFDLLNELWAYKMIAFDASQNLVIYPQHENGCYYSLWDRQDQKMLVRVETPGCFVASYPIWLPDESGFLISTSGEWFQANRNGDVRQLTHLRNSFRSIFIFPHPDLSPDGKYLAFSYTTNLGPSEVSELAVLNLKTSKVTYYGASLGVVPDSFYDLAWSPDSHYLAVGSTDGRGKDSTIVMDNVDQWAAHLVDNVLPGGWLK